MTQLQKRFQEQFPTINFQLDFDLREKTYFKVGGKAELFVELEDQGQISALIKFCHQEKIKFTVVGGLSNVIVDDKGIKGLVIKLAGQRLENLGADQESDAQDKKTIIQADAGVLMPKLVLQTVKWGLTGLENFLGVPGTLGGAIYNNSHYLQDLIGNYVTQVEVMDQDGDIKWLSQTECDFAYDHSRFHQTQEIILRVKFALFQGDKKASQQKIQQAQEYRARTQPLADPSSGCVFKNPLNTKDLKKQFTQFEDREFIPAGFLIDQAGLKGFKLGDLEVSTKHASFIVNHGQGSSKDLKELIKKIKQVVYDKFSVTLEEEVFYLS